MDIFMNMAIVVYNMNDSRQNHNYIESIFYCGIMLKLTWL